MNTLSSVVMTSMTCLSLYSKAPVSRLPSSRAKQKNAQIFRRAAFDSMNEGWQMHWRTF